MGQIDAPKNKKCILQQTGATYFIQAEEKLPARHKYSQVNLATKRSCSNFAYRCLRSEERRV